MKRIIIVGMALAALASAAVAYAASSDFNSYTAKSSFSPGKAGSRSKPSGLSRHELWTAQGLNGHETAPLTHIVERFYGLRFDGKDFPVCTARMINNAGNTRGWAKVCPKGSLVGSGPVNSEFVANNTPSGPGAPCNPWETVWNGGQGKLVVFFEEAPYAPGPQYTCASGAVKTGAAGAYNETYSVQGGFMVVNIPLPANVSTSAGGLSGIYASLQKLDVTYPKLTKKVHGKTVVNQTSVACKGGKRPYSYTFTAQNYTGQAPSTQTTTVSGSTKC